jgi:L-ascorbate metabolism protein UlaG (beta-lactamase superfamily)
VVSVTVLIIYNVFFNNTAFCDRIASMIITHYGREHFKLQVGDLTIAVNPVSKEGKGKVSKYGADITLITTNHPDYNGVEQTEMGTKVPFVIRGAGEYEVNDIFIKGFSTVTKLKEGKTQKEYQNTSYVFVLDGIRVTFLGALSQLLAPEHKEVIDETDVLFIPVGSDEFLLNPYDAHKLAVSLEPKLIIPMDYDEQSLPIFLKEAGSEKADPVEKLTIKKKDIDGKLGEVVLFHEM